MRKMMKETMNKGNNNDEDLIATRHLYKIPLHIFFLLRGKTELRHFDQSFW